jgi:transcriptional regulator with XRE-family HTH domain
MEGRDYLVTLKAARVNAGLSQAEASERIGISKTTLSKYESGETSPTVQTLKIICDVYSVPTDAISFSQEVD